MLRVSTIKSVRIKSRSKRPKFVYNLSIKKNHNYFANGFLLHNCDDPNNSKAGVSAAEKQTVINWIHSPWSSRLNDRKTGRLVYIQQRLAELDASGYLMDLYGDTLVRLVLPMEFESGRRAKTIILPSTKGKKWEDPRKQEGELLWPEHIGQKELAELKLELGNDYNISGQLQQLPIPLGGGIIKGAWFEWWTKEKYPKILHCWQSVDTAYGEGEENAFSAITTWGYFEQIEPKTGRSYPCVMSLNVWRGRLLYPLLRQFCQRVYYDYRDDGSRKITPDGAHSSSMMLVEAKANGLSLVQDLRAAGIHAVGFNPNKYGDKNQRVVLSTTLLQNGLVYVPAQGPDFKRLMTHSAELLRCATSFPTPETRDVVDTMSQMLLYLQSNGYLNHRLNPEAIQKYQKPVSFYGPEEYMQRDD